MGDFPRTVSTAQMWQDLAEHLTREIATMEAQGRVDDHWQGAIQSARDDLRLVNVRAEWAKGHDEQINAEISRLRAEVADERRAVERLAGLADDCPPSWPCNWGRDDESCAMCRAAWARSKEVK